MNATEQRMHRTVTQSLDKRLEDVEAIVLRLMKNEEWLKSNVDSLVARQETLQSTIRFHVAAMTRWQRLRWLLKF